MTLFDTVFKRRSVRSFVKDELSEVVLDDIQSRIDGLKQLEGQSARFEIVPAPTVKNDKAPHYILAFCEKKAEAFINVGYCLQEMDLFIQSLGLGSLGLGRARPKADENNDDFCIMLAFGSAEVPFRNGENDFNRLEISEIANADNDIIRAARLAPSAVNSQPWQLVFEEGKISVKYRGRGLLKAVLRPKLSKIDIGIIAKIAETALIESGKTDVSVLPQVSAKSFGVNIFFKE